MNKKSKYKIIVNKINDLRSSPLYSYRIKNNYKAVTGEGSLNAIFMFIGEAPGKNEAEQGKPFIGAAGKKLDELLQRAGLNRQDIFITSILFDRPPKNRNPKKVEIEIYKPFLIEILDLIEPKIIVTLGNFAVKTLEKELNYSRKFHGLGVDHGKIIEAKIGKRKVKIFPSYHPAAMFYNRKLEKVINKDFTRLKNMV